MTNREFLSWAQFLEYVAPVGRAGELDPISLSIRRDTALIFFDRQRNDHALEQCHRTIALDAGFYAAWWALGMVYERMGRLVEAMEAFQHGLVIAQGNPRMLGALGHGDALVGRREEAFRLLADLHALSETR